MDGKSAKTCPCGNANESRTRNSGRMLTLQGGTRCVGGGGEEHGQMYHGEVLVHVDGSEKNDRYPRR